MIPSVRAWSVPVVLSVLLPLCVANLEAQSRAPGGLLFFDALPFAGEGLWGGVGAEGRVDLYAAVPYTALDFSRQGDLFAARYRLSIAVRSDDSLLLDTVWSRDLTTREVGRTTGSSPAFDFYQLRLPVDPGSYICEVELIDFGTNLTTREKRNVTVIPFNRYRFSLSGLLLVGKIREESDRHHITPLLTDNVSRSESGYFLFFEVYNRRPIDTVDLIALYRNEGGEEIWRERFRRNVAGDSVEGGRIQTWIRLPNDGFPRGEYTVDVIAALPGDSTDTVALTRRKVRIEGLADGMPLGERELEERIDRLRYVATQEEIDRIDDAGTFQEKRRVYADFWEKRDPTPGTPTNEAMEEYFRRVEHADQEFRSYAEGWLTDMGRVYIVFGPPDRVDRDPFAADGKPRETWEYFGRGGRLVFVDQTGFGDFRLLTPVSLSEKYRY